MKTQRCGICGEEKLCWWVVRVDGKRAPLCSLCEHGMSKPEVKSSFQDVSVVDAEDLVEMLIELNDTVLKERLLAMLATFQEEKWNKRLKELQEKELKDDH